MIGKDP
jgi:hypothetical protein